MLSTSFSESQALNWAGFQKPRSQKQKQKGFNPSLQIVCKKNLRLRGKTENKTDTHKKGKTI
jgi:hypothetical protein